MPRVGCDHKFVDSVRCLKCGWSPRVYLAGPMTGIPGFNFPAFDAAAAELRARGRTVVSPHEIHGETADTAGSLPYDRYLRDALAALLTCDAIAMMPGWSKSRGATVELQVARALAFPVLFLDGAEEA